MYCKSKLFRIVVSVTVFLLLIINVVLGFPVYSQDTGFSETFDDPSLPGWEHSPEVAVADGVLHVPGPGFAFLDGEWGDLTLSVRLQRFENDGLAISYSGSDSGNYHVVLGADFLLLHREVEGEIVELGGIPVSIPEGEWVQIGIRGIDGSHEVTLNGQQVLTATDPAPLPPGGIGFEVFSGVVEFDDLIISSELTVPAPDTTETTSPPSLATSCVEQEDITVCSDLEYASYEVEGAEQELLLDLYLPGDVAQPFPLLIYIHGGGWFEGDKDMCPGMIFARNGYATACIDYRLADDPGCPAVSTFPAQIHDVKAAVRWLRGNADQYGLDPEHFGAIGDSSGGHLAALLGTSYGEAYLEGTANTGFSDAVQAVADWYGPVDIIQGPVVFDDDICTTEMGYLNDTYGGEETPYFYWTMAWGRFLGGSLADSAVLEQAAQSTPLTYVDVTDPPFLVIHGEADSMVPISQSESLVNALSAAGVEVVFIHPPGIGHGFYGPEGPALSILPEFLGPTIEFFDTYLRSE